MSIFSEWPHNWYGFTRTADEKFDLPVLDALIDPLWTPEDKGKIIVYLDESPVAIVSQLNDMNCELCGESIGNPSCYKSDGLWLWPISLSHEVKKHSVRLPDRMVKDIQNNNYSAPTKLKSPYDWM